MEQQTVSFLPLGGIGDVTRNMYLYEYQNQILIVDCGLGFADETMLGVDLLLPDISYLLKVCFPIERPQKKIVGMVVTHGHEDHMGALPFILPQLPDFPIFASPFSSALANEKLMEYGIARKVTSIPFESPQEIKLGNFGIRFMRVTHSIPDTAHILINTPVGNIYHGSDYKFDLTPADGKKSDYQQIANTSGKNVLLMLSDSLGSEREGFSPSEEKLGENFLDEIQKCKGKCIITTYSSNISRLNQAIQAAANCHRNVCFIGRSLIKTTDVAKKMGLLHMPKGMEISLDEVKRVKPNQLLLIVAGSQGQENSAMSRIANGEHKDVKLSKDDLVIFSADSIPGNEVTVNSLIDTISQVGATVLYSDISNKFHVSGHGSQGDLMLLMSLVKPQYLLPISGTPKHMAAYKRLAQKQGYREKNILLLENGQRLLLSRQGVILGEKIPVRNVYVDQVSGEEVETYVLRDRQKLSMEGVVIVMAEMDSASGKIVGTAEVVAKGFSEKEAGDIRRVIIKELSKTFTVGRGKVTNWVHMRKLVADASEKAVFHLFKKRPLILPVVVEV
ncbi:MAG: ribonuclease J [Candidatus Levyibacteriota bacterium]